jgi:hypothetical protein
LTRSGKQLSAGAPSYRRPVPFIGTLQGCAEFAPHWAIAIVATRGA